MTDPIADLFAQFHGPLVRMLYRRTGDRERAEEIAQEVFARAVAAPPRNPRPWLFAVALNLVREEARTTLRRERRLVLYRAEQADQASRPDEELDRGDRIARVRAALDELSPDATAAVRARVIEGLPYEEVARRCGCSVGAARVRVSRALAGLLDRLDDLPVEEVNR